MPARPRVVADSNVIISALHGAGNPRRVLLLANVGKLELFHSPFIVEEVARILADSGVVTGQRFRRVIHDSPRSVRMSDPDPIETLTALTQPFVAKQLYESRTILIMGEINPMLAERITAQLLALSGQSREPIRLFINSNGGHVESGDTIHDMIKFVEPRVIMVGTGWVASAGTHIYLAVPREDRYALPNTRFMIHQPLGGVGGRAADLQIEAEEILKARERLNRTIADATGQPLAKVRKDTDRNFWMSPAEAREYGIVGTIVSSSADMPR